MFPVSRERAGDRRAGTNRAVRWMIQILLTALVTVFLFRAIQLSLSDLRQLDWSRWLPAPLTLTASVSVLVIGLLGMIGLWARLATVFGAGKMPFSTAVAIFSLANLGRYVPGKVWQLAGLAYLSSRSGLAPGPASVSALVAQIFTLAAALAVGGFYAWSGPLGGWTLVPVALAVAAAVSVVATPRLFRFLLTRFADRLGGSIPLPAAAGPGFALRWVLLYALTWSVYSAAFCLLWAAFRPLEPAQLLIAATAFPAAYFAGYIAFFAPAGIGVREGALAALTAPVLGPADATALALIARVWMTAAEFAPLVWVALRWGGRRTGWW